MLRHSCRHWTWFSTPASFEGLSVATLEALLHGMPVVASKVGGQGEITAEGLTLLPADAPRQRVGCRVGCSALGRKYDHAGVGQLSSYRLWTLVGLARPFVPGGKTLFVTANLNSGGAQRSLVNLTMSLVGKLEFEIAVAGISTESHFYNQLVAAGVKVSRIADNFDAFSNAEALVHKICAEKIGTLCYWNVDPKVKLLVTKALSHTNVQFLDVSPGGYAFEEMAAAAEFCEYIAYSQDEYYRRLGKLVLKFNGRYPPACKGKTIVIENGVPPAARQKTDYALHGPPRVAVNGRIAPSKFLLEIVEAMRLVRQNIPDVAVACLRRRRAADTASMRTKCDRQARRLRMGCASMGPTSTSRRCFPTSTHTWSWASIKGAQTLCLRLCPLQCRWSRTTTAAHASRLFPARPGC